MRWIILSFGLMLGSCESTQTYAAKQSHFNEEWLTGLVCAYADAQKTCFCYHPYIGLRSLTDAPDHACNR